MLKKFFLNLLSSFIGAWLAFLFICGLVVVGIILLLGALGSTQKYHLEKGSLMVVELSGVMDERETTDASSLISMLTYDQTQVRSLEKYVGALEEAAVNDNIDAIYLKCDGLEASPATLNTLRAALEKCRKNGKKIYAYADNMTQADYFLASVAAEIYVNPQGSVSLQGIGGYTPYFKGLLDKVGVDMQVVKVGTFKSAVEPYILQEMSDPARAQLDTLYNNIWSIYKDKIAESRKIEPWLIDTLINRDYISVQLPNVSVENKLIDGTCYRHEMEEKLAKILRKDKFDDINIVDVECMYNEHLKNQNSKGDEIAVVYAVGEIDGGSGGIQSSELVPLILDLADNDDVKAMVLRVNSPGGSAYGSEQIWEALTVFKSKGKKLIVSMGDYAASGGYYISCCADKIYADPMTITGSIGIFGMIPCVDELLTDKLGINMQMVSTNPNGMFPSLYQPLTPGQYDAMQKMVEQGYDTFTLRVADGRGMLQERVKQIGEGRVWDGKTALELKLVDELGTLQDAIAYAAKASGTNEYYTVTYPEINPLWASFDAMRNAQMQIIIDQSTPDVLLMKKVEAILQRKPLQARMQEMVIRL